jgi:hypothetical protein
LPLIDKALVYQPENFHFYGYKRLDFI